MKEAAYIGQTLQLLRQGVKARKHNDFAMSTKHILLWWMRCVAGWLLVIYIIKTMLF